jgi:hypothetical protein
MIGLGRVLSYIGVYIYIYIYWWGNDPSSSCPAQVYPEMASYG